MQLTVERCPSYIIARTSGPLDESARDAFRAELHPLVSEGGAKLILDLGDSPRINSPGISNLVALVADANSRDSRVVFCRIPAFIASVLNITKLNTYFDIVGTLEEAIDRVQQPAK